MNEDVDVIPVRKVVGNRAERRFVSDVKILEGLIGEDDAPAKGVVMTIALEDGDLVRCVRLLQQKRGIEAGGPAA